MRRGIIVSIQEYSHDTTQELAERAVQAGAVAIRTDRAIKINVPVIGLKKDFQKEFYITTDIDAINEVAKWATYVAIDCRAGNREREALIEHCNNMAIPFVADIENYMDYETLQIKPGIVATTFSSMRTGRQDFELLKKLYACHACIIAEGGIKSKEEARRAFSIGAYAVCVGTEIMDIRQKVAAWVHCISGGLT